MIAIVSRLAGVAGGWLVAAAERVTVLPYPFPLWPKRLARIALCATGNHWCCQMDSSCYYCGLRAERSGNPYVVLPQYARGLGTFKTIWFNIRG